MWMCVCVCLYVYGKHVFNVATHEMMIWTTTKERAIESEENSVSDEGKTDFTYETAAHNTSKIKLYPEWL